MNASFNSPAMPAINDQTSLSDLYAHAMELKAHKTDYAGKPADFRFNDDGRMQTPKQLFGSVTLSPDETALSHLCWKLGAPYNLNSLDRAYFAALQSIDPALLAANFNHAIERMPESKGWLARAYDDTLRAVLSDEYLVIDNDDMLKTLTEILTEDATPHKLSTRSFVNVNNMSVDIRFKDVVTPKNDKGGNSHWGLGIRIRNGEVGDWTGGVYPMLWRGSCDNSIAFDDRASSFVFKHFGKKTLATKKVMLHAAMGEILPFAATLLDAMIEADGKALPKFGDIVNGLGIKHGWSEEFTQAVFAGSERANTVAGLINGITWASHAAPASQEQGNEAEFLAGRFLFDNGAMLREAEYIYNAREQRNEAKERREAQRQEREAQKRARR